MNPLGERCARFLAEWEDKATDACISAAGSGLTGESVAELCYFSAVARTSGATELRWLLEVQHVDLSDNDLGNQASVVDSAAHHLARCFPSPRLASLRPLARTRSQQ